MEQRTVSEILKILQPLLKDFEKDEGLILEDAFEEPGSKIGDNYMSIVMRTKVTGKRGNGDPYCATFMTKRFPRHRCIVDLVRTADLFFNEAHTYTKLLPRFGSIAPKCIYADSDDIIMEDLRDRGYVVCERRNLLDLQHCEAALKALASLHARSLSLKLSKPKEFEALIEPLKEAVFPQDDRPTMGRTIDTSLLTGIRNLKSIENPDDELLDAIKCVEGYANRAFDILRDLTIERKEKYDVLTHGDAWNNNILFKHDADGRVQGVKLLDFQIVRHASPAIDFHYFVYSSARSSVVVENYEHLVQTYLTSLVNEMRVLGASDDVLRDLSHDWLKNELKKFSLFGLFTSFWIINAVLAEEDETIDMDTLTPEFLETLEKYEPPIRPAKVERMRCIVLHWMRTYR